MTRYELYTSEWENCTRCRYHTTRKNVVTGKADALPCDIAFVGEAPGETEDCHGIPFYGQAGRTLDDIQRQAVPKHLTVSHNNLTGCFPLDENREKEDPDDDCVKVCSPRLVQWIVLCQPKLIITVGKHAEAWLDQSMKRAIPMPKGVPIISITHPAAIARQPWVQREMSFTHCVITIKKAVRKVFGVKERTGIV